MLSTALSQRPYIKKTLFIAAVMIVIAVTLIVVNPFKTPAFTATWIWNGKLISEEKEEILAFAEQNGVDLLYLHIEQEPLDAEEYRSFIKEAGAKGIKVDALAGDPAWSLESNRESITEFMEWVGNYNRSVQAEERFHGVHVDIEPHVLPDWNENKEDIIDQWVQNIQYVVDQTRKIENLQVSADIPFWLHELSIEDKSQTVSKWLIENLDHITLMAYRDHVEGPNGILDIVNPIIEEAGKLENKVVVAVNVLKSTEGAKTTFFDNSADELEDQLDTLEEELGEYPAFKGYAIHDYDSWRRLESSASSTAAVFESNGIKQIAKVEGRHLTLFDGTDWNPAFWAGINLGATTPGHYPGELTPTREDYLRWFKQMQEMNVKVVRIYTILPPVFYEALHEYNEKQEQPLLFLQGIWSPDEALVGEDGKGRDAFTPAITEEFQQEIKDAVRVIHGDATLKPRHGHASGKYETDVSQYLLGWVVGTEWHPYTVKVTNETHPSMPPYKGTYITAKKNASPFESWLASMLDLLAEEEMKYGWQHPVSFTNWLTTDPLSHPNEPLKQEDLVSVDPMNLTATSAFPAGYFASYHVYPYYPDFMRYDRKYQTYRNAKGKIDPYAGYLRDLREHHRGIPLIVAEFGVPSSRGMAHYGVGGRHQGMHTEVEQGKINADMIRSIYEEQYDGAILFSWQDEWFKFTWNTIDIELPGHRRAMWYNRLTNEENFGVIAVEPGKSPDDTIVLDGKTDDWKKRENKKECSYSDFDLTVSHDEAYLHLLLKKKSGSWDFSKETLNIGFDTLRGGSRTADKAPGITFTNGLEFLLHMQGKRKSHLYVNSAYDLHTWRYGYLKKILPWDKRYKQDEQGLFFPWKLALNKPLYLPESKKEVPFEDLEVGIMKSGKTDPDDPSSNTLADWYAKGKVLEIRIPWMMLGFTDPSSRQVWKYPYDGNEIDPTTVQGVSVEPVISSNGKSARTSTKPLFYQWKTWDEPTYHERKKHSFEIVRKVYGEYEKPKSE